jgi:hypothetical protein
MLEKEFSAVIQFLNWYTQAEAARAGRETDRNRALWAIAKALEKP